MVLSSLSTKVVRVPTTWLFCLPLTVFFWVTTIHVGVVASVTVLLRSRITRLVWSRLTVTVWSQSMQWWSRQRSAA